MEVTLLSPFRQFWYLRCFTLIKASSEFDLDKQNIRSVSASCKMRPGVTPVFDKYSKLFCGRHFLLDAEILTFCSKPSL
jgi:hypothetical protein